MCRSALTYYLSSSLGWLTAKQRDMRGLWRAAIIGMFVPKTAVRARRLPFQHLVAFVAEQSSLHIPL